MTVEQTKIDTEDQSDINDADTSTETRMTPLPRKQMLVLMLINVNEAVAVNVLWAFLPFFVDDSGISNHDGSKTGYFVGLLASLFFLAQFTCSTAWGKQADRRGRRPVLLIGLLGSSASMVMFGFARSYYVGMAARILCGLLNGNIAITKTYLSEISDQTNQAHGFSLMAFSWGMGSIVAPAVGGFLSKPSERWPNTFPPDGFFGEYPYFLPCIFSAFVGALGAVLGYFFLPESSKWLARRGWLEELSMVSTEEVPLAEDCHTPKSDTPGVVSKGFSSPGQHSRTHEEVAEKDGGDEALPIKALMSDVEVRRSCLSYGAVALLYILFEETMPLFCKTKPELGGLGFHPSNIGMLLTAAGVSLAIFQFFFFPRLALRLGTANTFRYSCAVSVPFFVLFPLSFWLQSSPETLWAFLLIMMALKSAVCTCMYTSVIILVNNSAPDNSIGAVNGIGQSITSLARAIGPLVGGAAWSVSTEVSFTGHQTLIYCMMSCMAFGLVLVGRHFKQFHNLRWNERQVFQAKCVGSSLVDTDMTELVALAPDPSRSHKYAPLSVACDMDEALSHSCRTSAHGKD